MALMDAARIRTWKEAALRPDTAAPVPTHHLDQILAAAREAGLNEREQGVLLLTMTLGDLESKLTMAGKLNEVSPSKRLAISASMAMRMLQSQVGD